MSLSAGSSILRFVSLGTPSDSLRFFVCPIPPGLRPRSDRLRSEDGGVGGIWALCAASMADWISCPSRVPHGVSSSCRFVFKEPVVTLASATINKPQYESHDFAWKRDNAQTLRKQLGPQRDSNHLGPVVVALVKHTYRIGRFKGDGVIKDTS